MWIEVKREQGVYLELWSTFLYCKRIIHPSILAALLNRLYSKLCLYNWTAIFLQLNSRKINSFCRTVYVCTTEQLYSILSYIRKKESCPAPAAVSRSGYPPWILKRGGLESSGQKLISSFGKTKRIAFLYFFFGKKKYFQNFQIFWKKVIFWDFLRF